MYEVGSNLPCTFFMRKRSYTTAWLRSRCAGKGVWATLHSAQNEKGSSGEIRQVARTPESHKITSASLPVCWVTYCDVGCGCVRMSSVCEVVFLSFCVLFSHVRIAWLRIINCCSFATFRASLVRSARISCCGRAFWFWGNIYIPWCPLNVLCALLISLKNSPC